jgi:hypothetical protein
MDTSSLYTAFEGHKLFFKGTLSEVVLKIKHQMGKAENTSILIFSDATGKVIDFNFQGSKTDVEKRLEVFVTKNSVDENTGPGRPKLGVVSREVSLLPKHWEWLATQAGGASTTLRKLVDEAQKKSLTGHSTKNILEATHKFMSTLGGDLQGYEEALRALYRKDQKMFLSQIEDWPRDLQKHLIEISKKVFAK